MKKYFIISLLFMSSCIATVYKPFNGINGGYMEENFGAGIWIVKYKGNSYTNMNQAIEGVKKRADELALLQHKKIVEAHLDTYIEKHLSHNGEYNCEWNDAVGGLPIVSKDFEVTKCHAIPFEWDWPVAVLTIVLE